MPGWPKGAEVIKTEWTNDDGCVVTLRLDKKRLEAIRKKIADGFYNRNDVQRSIVDRLAHSLAQDCEGDCPADDATDDRS